MPEAQAGSPSSVGEQTAGPGGPKGPIYADESILTDGVVDPLKLRPFMLTMPDNSYWALGERIGEAWSMGKPLIGSKQ